MLQVFLKNSIYFNNKVVIRTGTLHVKNIVKIELVLTWKDWMVMHIIVKKLNDDRPQAVISLCQNSQSRGY